MWQRMPWIFNSFSRDWISRSVFSLGKEKRRAPICQMPTGRSRDIRLLTDPNLERREENAATTCTAPAVPISTTSASLVEDDFPPLTASAAATALIPSSQAGDDIPPLNVSLHASVPSEEERALLSEGDPDQHSIQHHEFMEAQPSDKDGSPAMDYLCPQRNLVREFEPVVRPLGRKYVPVPASRSPVRHQASEQSRPVTRRKPCSKETLEFRRSERRSPYRRSVGAQQPERRQATSSPKRRQDQHRDSDKRRRLDAYHPRNRAVTVEEPS